MITRKRWLTISEVRNDVSGKLEGRKIGSARLRATIDAQCTYSYTRFGYMFADEVVVELDYSGQSDPSEPFSINNPVDVTWNPARIR